MSKRILLILSIIFLGSNSIHSMDDINTAEQCGQMCQIGIGALAVSATVFTGYIVNKINQCMKTKEAPSIGPSLEYSSMSTVSQEQMKKALHKDIYSEEAVYHLPEWIIKSSLRKLDRIPLLKGVINYLAYHHSSDNTPSSHRFILKGSPGTGKTTLALSIAKKLGYRVVFRSATSLMGKYLNESTVNLRELLEDVSQSEAKTMLIIDELDALFKNRESHHNDHNANYRAFEAALDDFLRERNENVVIVGTTNDYDSLPESLQSRFGNNHFEIEPPSFSERAKIIRELFNNVVVSDGTLTEAYIDDLNYRMKPYCWSSSSYTDRDIHNLIDSARMLVYCERNTVNTNLDDIDLRPVKIGKKEIDRIFKQYPKSGKRLNKKEIFEYAQAAAHGIIIAEGLRRLFQASPQQQEEGSTTLNIDKEKSITADSGDTNTVKEAAEKIGGGIAAVAGLACGKGLATAQTTVAVGGKAAGTTALKGVAIKAVGLAKGAGVYLYGAACAHPYIAGGTAAVGAVGSVYYYYWGNPTEVKDQSLQKK